MNEILLLPPQNSWKAFAFQTEEKEGLQHNSSFLTILDDRISKVIVNSPSEHCIVFASIQRRKLQFTGAAHIPCA
jgi:hypothetical protein